MLTIGRNTKIVLGDQSNNHASLFLYKILVIDCGDPGPPYGGYRHIATDTKYQSTVTYTCRPDHHLEGEDSQVCQADGFWSGSKPVCLGNAVNYLLQQQVYRGIRQLCPRMLELYPNFLS